MGSKTRRVFSLVLGLGGLVLGACGGDDSGAVRSGSDASIEGDDSSMARDSGSAGDGSSSDGGNVDGGKVTNLFPPKPECSGDTVATAMGTNPQVISALQIGAMADGLDLDHDGKPDNAMSALASVTTTPISDALNATSLLRPIEFFNVHTGGPTACVKLAVYAGIYGTDDDADGSRTSVPGGDCNDHDPAIHPGATEIVGNGKDDDCDGLADESPTNVPSSDTSDADADGVTIAAGDCDDTDPTVHAGAAEVCADGKDNDCDGVADRSVDGTGHVSACSAFSGTADIRIDPQSLDGTGKPKLSFKDGAFVIGMDGKLAFGAGPDPFVVHMPFAAGAGVDFPITGAKLNAAVTAQGADFVLANGHLGGVLDANKMDSVTGATVPQIGLTTALSLLDAAFAGTLGSTLSLPRAGPKVTAKYPGCLTPDIDVDGDGLEAFCDSKAHAAGDMKTVDVCIDGDGTEIADMGSTPCTSARDASGNLRFVDGISIELNFTTVQIHSVETQ